MSTDLVNNDMTVKTNIAAILKEGVYSGPYHKTPEELQADIVAALGNALRLSPEEMAKSIRFKKLMVHDNNFIEADVALEDPYCPNIGFTFYSFTTSTDDDEATGPCKFYMDRKDPSRELVTKLNAKHFRPFEECMSDIIQVIHLENQHSMNYLKDFLGKRLDEINRELMGTRQQIKALAKTLGQKP